MEGAGWARRMVKTPRFFLCLGPGLYPDGQEAAFPAQPLREEASQCVWCLTEGNDRP